MTFKDRAQLAFSIMTGQTELVHVKLKGKVIQSSTHVTGGGGTMEIIGTFAQRGYGGYKYGTIVDIAFLAVQEDSPQQWSMKSRA